MSISSDDENPDASSPVIPNPSPSLPQSLNQIVNDPVAEDEFIDIQVDVEVLVGDAPVVGSEGAEPVDNLEDEEPLVDPEDEEPVDEARDTKMRDHVVSDVVEPSREPLDFPVVNPLVRRPSFRSFRVRPGGALVMYTPRKTVRLHVRRDLADRDADVEGETVGRIPENPTDQETVGEDSSWDSFVDRVQDWS